MEVDELQDPELQELAKTLPDVVIQGRTPFTAKKYSGAFRRWKEWALSKPKVCILPAKPLHIALYLNFLIQKGRSAAPVEEAVNALSWVHEMARVEDTTGHPMVQQALVGARRILAKKTNKKESITPEILASLVECLVGRDASLSDIRTITFCLLGFAGFFRLDELAKLKESDVVIYESHMELFVESSKTDQFRDGAWVVIARTGTNLCPVAMVERYMELAGTKGSPDKLLFQGLISTINGCKLRESGGLSYTRVRELVLGMLLAIGLDHRQFGLHSLRAGGASAAANAGVPDRLFKRHGRWHSKNAKDGYVKDGMEERLEVSRRIGL